MLIKLNFESDIPIYLQLRQQIVLGISSGDLEPGESLPTVRQLANDAGVNPMTVNKAYQLLKQEGFIIIDRRHGAMVNTSIPLAEDYQQHLARHLAAYVSEAKARGVSLNTLIDMISILYRQLEEGTHD